MTSSNAKGNSKKSIDKGPKLPWWVELLFVQIGLPDKWLPKILKNKNKTQKILDENRRVLIFILAITGIFAYLAPVRTYFSNQNTCTQIYNAEILKKENGLNRVMAKARSVKYCNGGFQD